MKLINIRANSFVKQLGIYTISSYVNKAIPFLLLPILTKYLTTDAYGELSMFLALVNLLVAIFGWSIEGAVTRNFYDKSKDFGTTVYNYLLQLICSFTLAAIIVGVFHNGINEYSGVSEKYQLLAVLCAFFSVVCSCVNSLQQASEEPVKYALFTNGFSLLNALLSIILVVVCDMSVAGRVLGITLSTSTFGIFGLYIFKRRGVVKKFDASIIKEELAVFGLPSLPMNLKGTILSFTDKIFIANLLSLSAAGVYTVSSQVAMLVDVFVRSIALAYTPWTYKKLSEECQQSNIKILKSLYLLIGVVFSVSLFIFFISKYGIYLILDEQYWGATDYLFWLIAANAVMGIQLLLVNFIYYRKKVKVYSVLSIVSILLNVLLNYLFIKSDGALGASKATFLVYSFTLLVTIVIVYRQNPTLPWLLRFKNE